MSGSVNRMGSQLQPELGYMHPPFLKYATKVKLSTGAGLLVLVRNGTSKLFNLDSVWVTLEYGLFFLNCYEWCKFPFTQWSVDIILSKEPVIYFFHTRELYSVRGYMHPPFLKYATKVKLSTGAQSESKLINGVAGKTTGHVILIWKCWHVRRSWKL
jgi:hypothetical protein